MPEPLHRVTIHHEGAGAPTDVPRGAKGGYTYWLGVSRWIRLRSAYMSYATLHYNHVSVDVCLSGERNSHPVTDNDLVLLEQICADARAHGELVDTPDVEPHRQSFNTNCPGDLTMARWADVRKACILPVVPTAPKPPPIVFKVTPEFNPPIPVTPVRSSLQCPSGGAWTLHEDGGVFGWGGAPFHGSPHGDHAQLRPGEVWAQIDAPAAGMKNVEGKPASYVCVTSDGDKSIY